MTHTSQPPTLNAPDTLRRRTAATILLCLIALAGNAQTLTYLVDRTDDSATGDCLDTVAQDCPLRRATILAAFDSTTSIVQVPDGVYLLDIAGADEDLSATGDLDLYATDSLVASPGARPIIEQTTSDRVIEAHELDNVATSITISGLTLRGGNVAGDGGGLHLLKTTGPIELRGAENAAPRGADLPVLTLMNLVITANHATGIGGGILVQRPSDSFGPVVLDNVTVQNNSSGNGGGGAALIGGPVEVFHSSFLDNQTDALGGGLALGSDNALLEDVRLHGNRVLGGAEARGGGLAFAGNATIRRSSIAWNRAGDGTPVNARGGGIYFQADVPPGSLFLDNVTVIGNRVDAASSELGAQVSVEAGNLLDLDQVTISDPFGSGGLHVESQATVRIEASIIDGGCDLEALVNVATQGYSVERPPLGTNTTCLLNPAVGDLVTAADLDLAPAAVYGGPAGILTMPPLATSPARLLASSTHCLATDAREAARVLLFCDAGSHESSAVPTGQWIFADGFESGDTGAWALP